MKNTRIPITVRQRRALVKKLDKKAEANTRLKILTDEFFNYRFKIGTTST